MSTHEFRYPSCLEAEEQMLCDIEAALEPAHLDIEQSHRFRLAVSEAFTNAWVHGNGRNRSKQVTVRLTVNDNLLAADIIDEGRGGLAQLRSRKPRGLMAEGGRGIDLIERFADSVEYAEEAHGGLRVSFSFVRKKEQQIHI